MLKLIDDYRVRRNRLPVALLHPDMGNCSHYTVSFDP